MSGIDGLGIAAYSYMNLNSDKNKQITDLKDEIYLLKKALKAANNKIKRLEKKVLSYKLGEIKDWK